METTFGPPSEPIDIAAFLQSAQQLEHSAAVSDADVLQGISEERLCEVLAECSVNDIRKTLFDLYDDPRISAHLTKEHQSSIDSLFSSSAKRPTKKRKKHPADTDQDPTEVVNLQREIDATELESGRLQPESVMFMRTPRNYDYNVLRQPKLLSDVEAPRELQAVVVVSIYKKTSWNAGLVTRISQHALLSSQTLSQLFDAIPCTSKEIPREIMEDGRIIGYSNDETIDDDDCVICIESRVYGDGCSDNDYADKLMEHLKKVEKKSVVEKAAKSMRETDLCSLTLRVNEPYWLLHAGNCEHFVVIDQIRLKHESDPHRGYPLTLQITPLLLDLCRVCGKVPAVWSIVNDIRLSESPFLICKPCWGSMENGKKEEVIVVPLPAHRAGW